MITPIAQFEAKFLHWNVPEWFIDVNLDQTDFYPTTEIQSRDTGTLNDLVVFEILW